MHSRVGTDKAVGFVISCCSVQNVVEKLILTLARFVRYKVEITRGLTKLEQ